jgi:hypothetical protein
MAQWHIQEYQLNPQTRQLIPKEDMVLYTTAVQARQESLGSAVRIGEAVITNRGIAIHAEGTGLLGKRAPPIHLYIGYDRVRRIEGRGAEVELYIEPWPAGKEKEDQIDLEVQRCEPDEKENAFKQRRKLFASVIEQALTRYRTGQAGPARPPPMPSGPAVPPPPGAPAARPVDFCPNCGASIDTPSKFCEHCGAKLPQQ